ncbi:MAG TPA: rhomboid family intramembrane serine protease, partial [Flavipsychrobacter sp.]|nr:rhomboid family intramembrane serine protease [Flavipsychrobacter sp.]
MQLFRTHYDSTVSAPYLAPEAFIVYVVSASQELGWTTKYVSPSGIIAKPQGSITANTQEVVVRKTKRGYVIKSENSDNSLRDWGMAEKHVRTMKDAIAGQIAILSAEEIAYRYEIIFPHLQTQDDKLEERRYELEHKKDGWWSFLKPVRGYSVTPVVLMINVLVFLLMVAFGASPIEPSARQVFDWGGNWGTATMNGDWWRLVTAAFVHIGFVHLFMNMAALVYIGAFLEPLIGTGKFVSAYLITAVAGSLLGSVIHPDTISAGASGAIFGMFGVLLSLLTTKLIPADIRKRLLLLMGFYVVYNLLYGMKEGVD